MSADNGIYIISSWRTFHKHGHVQENHKEKHQVFRVAEVGAIDNLVWYAKNQIENLGTYVYETWKGSPVFLSMDEALEYAKSLYDECEFVECGIEELDIDELIGKEFFFYGEY